MQLLTASIPTDWKELQDLTATILAECGFHVETEKTLDTVRGSVEVDVYAEETVNGRKYTIVCECKHWKTRVPQTVIHAFRTVVSDVGANVGYIVSSSGFQSGAFTASDLTTLRLLTWEEFQSEFCQTWLEKYMPCIIEEELSRLFRYLEPIVPTWMIQVPDHEVPVIKGLLEKYHEFDSLALHFGMFGSFLRRKWWPDLPLRCSVPETFNEEVARDYCEGTPDEILDATGYRDFLEALLHHGKAALAEFDAIRLRYGL